jgi:hypothetical protein
VYGSRTPTGRGRRREREATYGNSTELRGMDSTLPTLKEFRGTLIGPLMDAREDVPSHCESFSTKSN